MKNFTEFRFYVHHGMHHFFKEDWYTVQSLCSLDEPFSEDTELEGNLKNGSPNVFKFCNGEIADESGP